MKARSRRTPQQTKRLPRPPAPPSPRAVFTIVSANYIAYAATLMQSLRAEQPDLARFVILADTPRRFSGLDLAAELIPCDDLGIPHIANMRFWYDVLEFNTAIKPFVFRYLIARGFAELCYLDPDILVLAPLSEAFSALAAHSLVLTPHIMAPLQDGMEPSDLTIMKSGVYNLGFVALRDDAEARRLLLWWSERCFTQCRVDIAGHLFTDQRWMDLAPSLVANCHILRHPGYNVAYWNLPHRPLARDAEGAWQAGGERLVFFHFSGLDVADPAVFSKHQNRFHGEKLGPAGALVGDYRARLIANGWARYRGLRYGFAHFANGRPIEPPMRRYVLRAIDEGRLIPTNPLDLSGAFFDEIDDTMLPLGVRLTRFMVQLWRDRPDLSDVFDIQTREGQARYLAWFLAEARWQGIDGRSVAAAARLTEEGVGPRPDTPPPLPEPPWPALAEDAWPGPARDALALLGGDVVLAFGAVRVVLPRAAALGWEARADLRRHFPLTSLASAQDFLAWAITAGVTEDLLDPAAMSADFLAQMTAISEISGHYGDVPLTYGMLLTRGHHLAGCDVEARGLFPAERQGRLAHGLWYAYAAPERYRWPAAMIAPVRAWFAAPTPIGPPGFVFNRAMLAIWELRPDLQNAFPLAETRHAWAYLHWLLCHGFDEFGFDPLALEPRLAASLLAPSPRYPRLPIVYEMIHAAHADLQAAIDLAAPDGPERLYAWAVAHYPGIYGETVIGKLLGGASPPELYSRHACPDFPLTASEVALWETWGELRQAFPLDAPDAPHAGFGYLHWTLTSGAFRAAPGRALRRRQLRHLLAAPSPRYPGLPLLLEMVHAARPELQNGITLASEAGRTMLRYWAARHFAAVYRDTELAAFADIIASDGEIALASEATAAGAGGRTAGASPAALTTRLLLSGLFLTPSGRGEDLRAAAMALRDVGCDDFLILDRPGGGVFLPDGTPIGANQGIEVDTHLVFLNADTALEDARFFARRGVAARRIIGVWAWELEWLPRRWRHAFSFYDEIWAASAFAHEAFAREALRPVRLVPPVVWLPADRPPTRRAELGLPEEETIFFFMFDFLSHARRKNPETVIEAFTAAFPSGEEKARLLIKTQGGDQAPEEWRRLSDLCLDPRIELRDARLDRAEVIALIEAADAFVSLHRAEGFGRGPAEAMWLGKPVIVTGYSGTSDFADRDTAFIIGYRMVPVSEEEYPGTAGQSWAEPDMHEAALAMRMVHAHPDQARAIAARGRERVQTLYHPESVGRAMAAALGFDLAPGKAAAALPGTEKAASPKRARDKPRRAAAQSRAQKS